MSVFLCSYDSKARLSWGHEPESLHMTCPTVFPAWCLTVFLFLTQWLRASRANRWGPAFYDLASKVLWTTLCPSPKIHMFKSYPPVPTNVTALVDIEVIKIKWDHKGEPFQYDWCPYKKKLGQRQHKPRNNHVRTQWGGGFLQVQERWDASEETNHTSTLMSDFQSPQLWKSNFFFCWLSHPGCGIWCSSPRELTHTSFLMYIVVEQS